MGGPGLVNGKAVSCTDNFYPCTFVVGGKEYSSAENYFQCRKCVLEEEHERVRKAGPGYDSWRLGSAVQLRPDWEEIKVRVMYEANAHKFLQHKELRDQLLATSGSVTFRASSAFWNEKNGLILELVREQLRAAFAVPAGGGGGGGAGGGGGGGEADGSAQEGGITLEVLERSGSDNERVRALRASLGLT